MNCFFDFGVPKKLKNEPNGITAAVLISSESSFLRHRLISSVVSHAEKQGLSCLKFLSKYDYDKLCAVYIKSRKTLVADKDIIPDLSEFSDAATINADKIYSPSPDFSVIKKLKEQRRLYISDAAKCENSAAVISRETAKIFSRFTNKARVLNYILRFIQRNGLRQSAEKGSESVMTLGNITSWGVHTCFESIAEKCSDVYTVCDCAKYTASLLINGFSSAFCQCGKDTEKFVCSLCPEFSEHLCVPELSLAVVCENDYHPYRCSESGEISVKRFLNRPVPPYFLEELRCNGELKDELIDTAVFALYDAMEKDNELCRYLQAFESPEKYEILEKEVKNSVFRDLTKQVN